MSFSIAGKHALVVGGTGRLGPIWQSALGQAGASVTAWSLPEVDISRDDGIPASWKAPDVVVINAGVDDRPGGKAADAQCLVDVNLLGMWRMLDRCSWLLSGTSIICLASLYALVAGTHKHPMYGATKAGVVNLVRHYAAVYGPKGIRVNALALGGVQDDQPYDFICAYAAKVPLGRMAQPADIVGPLLFLASDSSRYVTGHTLVVDGGYTCL